MQFRPNELGKLDNRDEAVGSVTVDAKKSHLVHLRDLITKKNFLIDSGAEISVIPATKMDWVKEDHSTLSAANGSPINTYGEKLMIIDIGLGRKFSWPFIVADVSYPIIGADFLSNFNLSINLHNSTVTDVENNKSVQAHPSLNPSFSIAAARSGYHQDLLKKFPSLTKDCETLPTVRHNHVHHIPTTGKPTFVRPRKMNPRMQSIAKESFQKMLKEGIIRPSSSPYAAPLHMVPKQKGWRPVGDYRGLNKQTIRDTYPLPYLHDFSLSLHGKTVFSRLDLKDAFFQFKVL